MPARPDVRVASARTWARLTLGAESLRRSLRAHQSGARDEIASSRTTIAAPLIVRDAQPVLMLTTWPGGPFVSGADLVANVRAGRVRHLLLDERGCGSRGAPHRDRPARPPEDQAGSSTGVMLRRCAHQAATSVTPPSARPPTASSAAPAGPASIASVATVAAQHTAPAALATAKRGHGIRDAPAITAATIRTPGTHRPKNTVAAPYRAKKRSARCTA